MTLETAKKEIDNLVQMFQKDIELEEKQELKTANYGVYLDRLEKAKKLKEEVYNFKDKQFSKADEYCFEMKITRLKSPIC